MDSTAVIMMNVLWGLTYVTRMLTALTPLEVMDVHAESDILEMESAAIAETERFFCMMVVDSPPTTPMELYWFVWTMSMALCVMTSGTLWMPQSSALSWDSQPVALSHSSALAWVVLLTGLSSWTMWCALEERATSQSVVTPPSVTVTDLRRPEYNVKQHVEEVVLELGLATLLNSTLLLMGLRATTLSRMS
jgi:hypothetical protein